MAVTASPRLGLTRWSAGTDPFARTQLDGDHAKLDDLAAIDGQGTIAARPAFGIRGRYYYATDEGKLYRDTGAAWVEVALAGAYVAKAGDTMTGRLVLKSYREGHLALPAVAAGGTQTIDLAAATMQHYDGSAGNHTVAFANAANGDSVWFRIYMSPVVAITWPTGVMWNGGAAPALEAGHNVFAFTFSDVWFGTYAGRYA